MNCGVQANGAQDRTGEGAVLTMQVATATADRMPISRANFRSESLYSCNALRHMQRTLSGSLLQS